VRRRCLAAGNAYAAQPYPGRTWLFQATRMTDWVSAVDDDGCNGWQAIAPGRVLREPIECEHLDLFKRPWIDRLAQRLGSALASLRQ
jgi:thioesterase domain-containing protein